MMIMFGFFPNILEIKTVKNYLILTVFLQLKILTIYVTVEPMINKKKLLEWIPENILKVHDLLVLILIQV